MPITTTAKTLIRQILSFGPSRKAELRLATRLLDQPETQSEEIRKHLPDLLASGDWQVRNLALKLAAHEGIGSDGRTEGCSDLLVDKLLDRGEVGIIRRNAAELLRKRGEFNQSIQNALSTALHDGYWEVRAEAARAMAALDSPSVAVERRLLGRLFAQNGKASDSRSSSLNKAGSGDGKLPRRLREKNFEVRAGIAEALGSLGISREAFVGLNALSLDARWLVRCQATIGLAHLAARQPAFLNRALHCIRQVDHVCSGTLPTFIFPRRISVLVQDLEKGPASLDPATFRDRYVHLKNGWHRIDETQW